MGLFDKLFKKKINSIEPQNQAAPKQALVQKDNVPLKDKVQAINLQNAKQLDTDLVEASYHRGCCGECAKYRKRWFSISGKDKRFPKMPVNYGCTCSGIDFYPVIYGISEPTYADEIKDIIEYSNRPFVDDRDDEEKKIYEMYIKEKENEKVFEPYALRWEAIKGYDRQQYDMLVKGLPDIAPKSFSGYMRMKNGNTKNFQKIIIEAEKAGIQLDYTGEIKKEIEELTPIREKYIAVKSECLKFYDSYK